MPRYRVMMEQITYRPWFKEIDAPSANEANAQGKAEFDAMTLRQQPTDLGWAEGDDSTEYELREDVIEEVKGEQ